MQTQLLKSLVESPLATRKGQASINPLMQQAFQVALEKKK